MVSLSAINGDAVTGLRKSRLSRLQQGTAGGRESGRLIQGVLLFFLGSSASLLQTYREIFACLCTFTQIIICESVSICSLSRGRIGMCQSPKEERTN